ncbi:hypothetical protein E2C01_055822 [Portunus trituberculatus]|uniref:Uncharacterized protein n=1 Tax=Portunus trituberculatus TaxID=210409 RepID=A0A5B7GX06_PORTR|nr:hypothetical protein [Portunus trituberculatus]
MVLKGLKASSIVTLRLPANQQHFSRDQVFNQLSQMFFVRERTRRGNSETIGLRKREGSLHDSGWGVVCGGSVLTVSRVRRGKVASSLPSRPRDSWGGPLGRKGSSWCLCR